MDLEFQTTLEIYAKGTKRGMCALRYQPEDHGAPSKENSRFRLFVLYFTKDELDSNGTGHNKPQYITMQCKKS